MNTKPYNPNPVDTSRVELSDELLELVERMAKHVHEVWAATRIAQGWTYGPERNDAERKHPCLVPYDQLPEEEKAYDRATSQETLKFIMLNGFEITHKNKNTL
ncbi:MAG: Ryanodine receptor Ryr [Bacteroidales bacterium]|nr:Ryanodine receptor Ryr [Bacteroidales bacterium]